ncbi:MAG: TetR/AcrR family transcriptional regulator [Gammaproteobacteria bacterium]|nr:TetR/AcrR family transcriptional regulator [Gammaproteobacteria bacterium]
MEPKAPEHSRTVSAEPTVAARKRAATRTRILAAALAEFAVEGFEGASMNAVGVRAGVANGTVFFHFKSKPLLYREVVRHAADAFHAAVSPVARSPGTSFLQVVEGHVDFLGGHLDIAALLWSVRGVHSRAEVREAAREVDARLVGVWRDWISVRRAACGGALPAGDDLARLAASAVSGLLAAEYVDPARDARAALAGFGAFVETAVAG